MARKGKQRNYFEPQRHPDHPRPITRRQLISQGFTAGSATVVGAGILGLLANPRTAHAVLAADLELLKSTCGIASQG
ncbi:MAG: hypothetical protein ABI567_11085, partial [Gammaproteobacteria bacterium]